MTFFSPKAGHIMGAGGGCVSGDCNNDDVFFLLGDSLASVFYEDGTVFRNVGTKFRRLRITPKERMQYSENGESLKSIMMI